MNKTALLFTLLFPHLVNAEDDLDIFNMSLEELTEIEIVSVAKKSQKASESPAAVFVISQQDIQRSGVTNIPDALKMAPGIHVARVDSNKWSVSSRGFGDRFANNLLVLIDGRSIYTPTFSGVYWEDHNLVLEDIDRIEVIRGPGGTVWGANAVNGVINIITKKAEDTEGGLITAGGGTEEIGFGSFRYGDKIGDSSYGRLYIKANQRGESYDNLRKTSAHDDWNSIRAGFRVDSELDYQNSVIVSGDFNRSDFNQIVDLPSFTEPFSVANFDEGERINANLTTKWQYDISDTSKFNFKMYYMYDRIKEIYIDQERNTFNLDLQHRFVWDNDHEIIWGLEYTLTHDVWGPDAQFFNLDPTRRGTQLISFFLQDEFTLMPNELWLTFGSKFEHNDYTGFEIQPSARLFWQPHKHHKFWGSVSRAVRTPSRVEDDLDWLLAVVPPGVGVRLEGDRGFDSENLLAFELGYRWSALSYLSLDTTIFYNKYTDLRSTPFQGPPFFNGEYTEVTRKFGNDFSANLYGFEASAIWIPFDPLQFRIAYSFLKSDITADEIIGVSPEQQLSLQANYSVTKDINFNLWLRYVDDTYVWSVPNREGVSVPSYITMDTRLAWKPMENLELSVVGQNLLNESQFQYVDSKFRRPGVEVQRSVYGKVSIRF